MRAAARVAAFAVVAAGIAIAPAAHANGRAPATSSITFRQGHPDDLAAGLTFGLVVSHDGGATWQWTCEDAVGYGGIFDPVFAYASSGALFATTFGGLRVARDGCTFGFAPLTASAIAIGSDGAVLAAESTAASSLIYRSTDDGVTFGSGVLPPGGMPSDWWQTVAVAPSDPQRVYLAGYRADRTLLLERSSDGGATFTQLPVTAFATSSKAVLDIAGIEAGSADHVYAHVAHEDGGPQQGLYRSDDAGATWTKILTVSDLAFGFAVRADGDLVVGTELAGAQVSHDRGASWQPLAGAPHINCLAESATGALYACTQNYQVPGGPPSDGAGILATTDLVTWTPVLRYQDITAPVACAAGTIQHDTCQVHTWCPLRAQLGITSTALSCPSYEGPPAVDAAPLGSGGCCDAGGDPRGTIALAAVLLIGWSRRSVRARHRTRNPPC